MGGCLDLVQEVTKLADHRKVGLPASVCQKGMKILENKESRSIKVLDHSYLNDILLQSSVEHLAIWIWHHIKKRVDDYNRGSKVFMLFEKILLWEQTDSWVEYSGQEDYLYVDIIKEHKEINENLPN